MGFRALRGFFEIIDIYKCPSASRFVSFVMNPVGISLLIKRSIMLCVIIVRMVFKLKILDVRFVGWILRLSF